ncbi:DUF2332 domain-containing protein [Thalassobaculum sp. OXR-137]|uniref:DUF2332 domain-containing protein n=1 Tax=Thalassobaculum sp. OXR-137 TaxID=3100173 RepID=UPI002AC9BDAF|nr:DUF2332 domain-containing protein [Thalassobaculum sp. OXR-137]WPZ34307.1 DUF2332 domain-containing protein [Thalassobaculum sp. OXR-137]
MDDTAAIAKRYRDFVEEQVRGRSPIYVALGLAVAETPETLAFLATLPAPKQQPNLLLAAVRHVCGVPADGAALTAAIRSQGEAIRAVMLSHSTQTNEPGRCALLMPVLARLPQPIALFEIGTSAGLCLYPDRYGYDYGGVHLMPEGAGDNVPVFPCAVEPAALVPSHYPTIAWRGGLDLNPLDATDPEQVAWLQTLVWPEQTDRADRLGKALAIARQAPVAIRKRSLLDPLDDVFDGAPAGATRVLIHSSVLAYIDDGEQRRQVCDRIRAACDVWICNEATRVLPWIAEQATASPPNGMFMQAVNGKPVAWTDPHGAALTLIGDRLALPI